MVLKFKDNATPPCRSEAKVAMSLMENSWKGFWVCNYLEAKESNLQIGASCLANGWSLLSQFVWTWWNGQSTIHNHNSKKRGLEEKEMSYLLISLPFPLNVSISIESFHRRWLPCYSAMWFQKGNMKTTNNDKEKTKGPKSQVRNQNKWMNLVLGEDPSCK